MYKNKIFQNIIFLFFFIAIVSALISASSGAMFEATKKIDSGKRIIILKNEEYVISWVTEKVLGHDKKYVDIIYKSRKNKKNKGSLFITLHKTSKNKIYIEEDPSSMSVPYSRTIKTKINTDNYYWNQLRPQITKLTKNSMLIKKTLRYNETKYFNRTVTDLTTNKTMIKRCKFSWEVYYFSKTSSIEISKIYPAINQNEVVDGKVFLSYRHLQNIRIDKYSREKLKITTYSYSSGEVQPCGSNFSKDHKYIKTKLSPKQYYLKVYKKEIETEKIT